MERVVRKNVEGISEKERRLQESLPYLGSETPVFPKFEIKEKSPLVTVVFWSIFIAVFIIFNSVFAISRVDGHSMDPTLKSGHFMLLSKHNTPKRFDIVVLKERIDDDATTKNIVKRVIGLPGDVVTVIDGILYINSKRYDEAYLDDENITNFKKVDWTIRVPKGHLFVLGDNRDISKDSRIVGSFEIDSSIVGIKIFGG